MDNDLFFILYMDECEQNEKAREIVGRFDGMVVDPDKLADVIDYEFDMPYGMLYDSTREIIDEIEVGL